MLPGRSCDLWWRVWPLVGGGEALTALFPLCAPRSQVTGGLIDAVPGAQDRVKRGGEHVGRGGGSYPARASLLLTLTYGNEMENSQTVCLSELSGTVFRDD